MLKMLKMFKKAVRIATLSATTGLLAVNAHATALSDVSFGAQSGAHVNPTMTALVKGRPSRPEINRMLGLFFVGDPWTMLDKTGSSSSSSAFHDMSFLLTGDVGSRSGNWGLGWNGSGLPLHMDLILVNKAANSWGAYLFESVSFGGGSGEADGTFDISWQNNGGNTPGLGFAAIYGRLSTSTDPLLYLDGNTNTDTGTDPSTDTGTGGSSTTVPDGGLLAEPVPTPGSLALLVLGLFLLRRARSSSRMHSASPD
jgi:hypothetical protein